MLETIINWLARLLIWIACGFMLGMVGLTCANITIRVFMVPISGTFELMGYFGAVAAALSLGYTQIRKGHIFVDIVYNVFPEKIQKLLSLINSIVCLCFFALISRQLVKWGNTLRLTEQVTETLNIIYYPFVFAVALGCAVLCLVFFVEILLVFSRKDVR